MNEKLSWIPAASKIQPLKILDAQNIGCLPSFIGLLISINDIGHRKIEETKDGFWHTPVRKVNNL